MMAALVQSFPSPSTSTMTMLQARSSPSESFPGQAQGQQHQRNSQMPRNIYNTPMGNMVTSNYRGQTSNLPAAPYAFTSTPLMQNAQNPLRQHPTTMPPRLEHRTSSAPAVPLLQQVSSQGPPISNRPRPPVISAGSTPLNSSQGTAFTPQSNPISSNFGGNQSTRPVSTLDFIPPNLSYANVAKSSPDRYKRNHQRAQTSSAPLNGISSQAGSAGPSGSGMATIGHLYNHPTQTSSTPALTSYSSYRGTVTPQIPKDAENFRHTSKDDTTIQRQSASELAKRYRRRSISSLEAKEYGIPASESVPIVQSQPKTYAGALQAPIPLKENRPTPNVERPTSSHGRNASNESSNSGRSISRPASAKRGSETRRGSEVSTATATPQQSTSVSRNEAKIVNVPARGSSEATKRLTNPSPLSQPMAMSPEQSSVKNDSNSQSAFPPIPSPGAGIPESPAAQQLAALNKKDGKKEGKSSRLRRAFSFGSAAELRKASAENSAANNASHERAKLRKDRFQDENEAQQAAIAQQQEASGLGEGIYSGQGHFFTGSTDNLSISSTASSASVMIRKMGKGVKKGSRSLVGLFRPKSIVGVPAADAAVPEASVAQVSMVTVEAEREKVNVNPNPHDHAGGGTGFPKLERNSMDATSIAPELAPAFSDRDSTRERRSIVGGEDERAKVLAAVKKGILKRTGTDSGNSSPVIRPAELNASDLNFSQVPRLNESPRSSSPGTPVTEYNNKAAHQRPGSVHLEGEDYFLSLQNFAANGGESRSLPGTPRGTVPRNISFSPRIIFHDTWTSMDYDRRGEIATCNRLTPMLAQQIKEELNTFKMEMEVHSDSKVYTHFF